MNQNQNLKPEVRPAGTSSGEARPVLVKRDWLMASVLLAVIVGLWIGWGVYKALTTARVPDPVSELMEPLSVTVDKEVLDELDDRRRLSEQQLEEGGRVILGRNEESRGTESATPTVAP